MDRSAKMLILISFLFLSVSSNLNLVDAQDGIYGPDSAVMTLTPDDFQAKVVDSGQIVFVQFYAPWCPPCTGMKPAWEKAAKALQGILAFGAIDADKYGDIKRQYPIKGFPTLKIFVPNASQVYDYNGERTPEAIVDYAFVVLQTYVIHGRLPQVAGPQ